jgi:hypothetical protein
MRIRDVFAEVGRKRGMPVEDDGASLLGVIGGFPVRITAGPFGLFSTVSITVRTGVGDFDALEKEIRAVRGTKALTLGDQGDAVRCTIPYSFITGSITGAVVIGVLDLLSAGLRAHYRPPAAVCGVCGRPGAEDIVVKDGLPTCVCPGCGEEIRVKRAATRAAYEATRPKYLRGFIYGLFGAAAGALVWAVLIILFESIYLLTAVVIAVAVAFLVKKGMGRVDAAGYVIVVILVPVSIVVGDPLAYVWVVLRETGSIDLGEAYRAYLSIIADNIGEFFISLLFALAGVLIGVVALGKMEEEARDRETI